MDPQLTKTDPEPATSSQSRESESLENDEDMRAADIANGEGPDE